MTWTNLLLLFSCIRAASAQSRSYGTFLLRSSHPPWHAYSPGNTTVARPSSGNASTLLPTPTPFSTDASLFSCLSSRSSWSAANESWFRSGEHKHKYTASTSIVTTLTRPFWDPPPGYQYPTAIATCDGVPYASGWLFTSTMTELATFSTDPFPTPTPECSLDAVQCLDWHTTSWSCAVEVESASWSLFLADQSSSHPTNQSATPTPSLCSLFSTYTPCPSPTEFSMP